MLEAGGGWSTHTLTLPEQAADNYFFQFRMSSAFESGNASANLDDIALIADRIE
jgi:hypothetical protein